MAGDRSRPTDTYMDQYFHLRFPFARAFRFILYIVPTTPKNYPSKKTKGFFVWNLTKSDFVLIIIVIRAVKKSPSEWKSFVSLEDDIQGPRAHARGWNTSRRIHLRVTSWKKSSTRVIIMRERLSTHHQRRRTLFDEHHTHNTRAPPPSTPSSAWHQLRDTFFFSRARTF